eukprot:TRINITY_DN33675_c0_g1_i4.p2 TRINITY_DN33675_c0_g1~~TRINITY_DN33675_c0_g1_i4.p2  ORF type:complete len:216 (+),score=-19.73 TRINITY_DN33675_c0_g1_i4:639-1286(+)
MIKIVLLYSTNCINQTAINFLVQNCSLIFYKLHKLNRYKFFGSKLFSKILQFVYISLFVLSSWEFNRGVWIACPWTVKEINLLHQNLQQFTGQNDIIQLLYYSINKLYQFKSYANYYCYIYSQKMIICSYILVNLYSQTQIKYTLYSPKFLACCGGYVFVAQILQSNKPIICKYNKLKIQYLDFLGLKAFERLGVDNSMIFFSKCKDLKDDCLFC